MDYKKLLVSSIFLISFSIFSGSAQNSQCGQTNHNKAIQAYYKKDYSEAINLVEQALACHPYYYYYYDAACIAAKAGDKEKSFSMLIKAIETGWANMDHLKSDSDLATLKTDKRWLELDNLKKEVKENLETQLQSVIEKSASTTLIPFKKNEKWGYVDSNDNTIVADAIFDKASFLNPKATLVFGQYYVYITSSGIVRWLEDPMFSEELKRDHYKVDSTLNTGFSVKTNKYYTKDYQYAPQYTKFKGHRVGDDFIGVVTNENGVSIIDKEGAVINNIENLEKIVFHNFGTDAKSDLYPVNDRDSKFVLFYFDKKGRFGYLDSAFRPHLISKKSGLTLPNKFFHSYTKQASKVAQYVFILKKEKYGIWDCSIEAWLFKPQFDGVIEINSVASKNSEESEVYFLVKEKGETYQINKAGKKFYPGL